MLCKGQLLQKEGNTGAQCQSEVRAVAWGMGYSYLEACKKGIRIVLIVIKTVSIFMIVLMLAWSEGTKANENKLGHNLILIEDR